MKPKWLIGSVLILIVLIFTLIFSLANTNPMVSIVVNCKNSSTSRYLSNSARWKLWWPKSQVENNGGIFHFRGDEYKLVSTFRNGSNLIVNPDTHPIPTHIRAFYKSVDSTLIQWTFSDMEKEGLFGRMINHYKRNRIQKEMTILLDSLKAFMNNPDKVYRFHIEQIPPIDTLMITTKRDFSHNPTTTDVYSTINYLRLHLNKARIKETGAPMMNVNADSGFYKLMVAIPIEKPFRNSGDIEVKRMVPSKFVCVDVVGGPKTLEIARQEAKLYMTDFEKVQMAIPFESLVTDRLEIPDTAKWKTRIYYPSF